MFIIGLTGGIASGKSTVSQLLAGQGAVIIDADKLGHQVYQPGTEGFRAIVEGFGPEVVAADGTIDRRKLGPIVFSDPQKMDLLNAITRPKMRALAQERFAEERARGTGVAVLEAAILLEAGWDDLCDEVWTVEVEPEGAIARLVSRNGLTREAALARINSQLSNDERRQRADLAIENDGDLQVLRAQVQRAWGTLRTRIAAAAASG